MVQHKDSRLPSPNLTGKARDLLATNCPAARELLQRRGNVQWPDVLITPEQTCHQRRQQEAAQVEREAELPVIDLGQTIISKSAGR